MPGKSVYNFLHDAPVCLSHRRLTQPLARMESSSTHLIVQALTKAIVEHRLQPGVKLAEQKLADHFGVSRTLVRQAFLQLSQHQLIRLEPSRGAFVASPSVLEARQVFGLRRLIEAEMIRLLARQATPTTIKALKDHVASEKKAMDRKDTATSNELLGDFHVRMAEMAGNEVLAQVLGQLISRCSLITLMYQSAHAAEHSHAEHGQIIEALAAKDEDRAARLLDSHLQNVEDGLVFEPGTYSEDISGTIGGTMGSGMEPALAAT